MTASTRRPRAASSAALSRIQSKAITKEAPKPKERKEKKEKDMCTICMDDFSEQRHTKIACGHQFHRTCILNWLEKQLRSSDQACPNCRAPYGFIMNGKTKEKSIGAYGDHQQPSLWFVHRLAKEREELDKHRMTYKTHLELTLQRQLAKTMESLTQLRAQRAKSFAIFENDLVSRQYIYDIDDEINKLSDRKKIYKEMEILSGAIGKGTLPERSPDVAWNLEEEMREARGLPKRGREPTPVVDSSDDEDEEIESDIEGPLNGGGVMRMHAPRSSRRIYIIINDSDDEVEQADTSVRMSTGGRVPRHQLESRAARANRSSQ